MQDQSDCDCWLFQKLQQRNIYTDMLLKIYLQKSLRKHSRTHNFAHYVVIFQNREVKVPFLCSLMWSWNNCNDWQTAFRLYIFHYLELSPLRVSRQKVSYVGQSLLGLSVDLEALPCYGWGDGYWMEELLGGTPAWWEGSFPRWKVGNTEDLQTWLEKSPSFWMRRFSDSLTATLPTENKSYQITPGLLPVLPAEKSPLYEITLIKTDCLREKMWLTLCSLFDGGQLERDQSLRLSSQYLSYLKERHIDEHLFCDFCYLGCETGWVA